MFRKRLKKNSGHPDEVESGGIEALMGIALGCIGMSMQDFERCTPSEFKATFDAWNRGRERLERSEWERVRMSCLCALQPYSKKKLNATDIMKFPWEKQEANNERREETREEVNARYEEAKRRFGLR